MEKTYWNNNGKYQRINDALWEILVPRMGQAKTEQGEALRIVSKIYYNYYDNRLYNRGLTSSYSIDKDIITFSTTFTMKL